MSPRGGTQPPQVLSLACNSLGAFRENLSKRKRLSHNILPNINTHVAIWTYL